MHRQRTIGVLTPFLGGNYYTDVIQSIHKVARQLKVNLIIIRTGGKYYDVPIAMNQVDGWLIINHAVEDHFLKQLEDRYKKPVVTVAKDIRKLNMNGGMVVVDNERAAYEAVMHLYQHGHRNIGYVGSITMEDMYYRYKGYLSAMRDLDLTVQPNFIYDNGDMTVFGGKQVASQLIADGFPITAALVSTDMCAFGIVDKLLENGYSVPQHLALIGFDNSSTARHSIVPITSIEQNLEQLLRRAVERLTARMKTDSKFEMDVLPCHMIMRQSCGCGYNEDELPREQSDIIEYANHINALRTENNVNYEFNRYILSYQFKHVRDLSLLLENYFHWGAIMVQQGYNSAKEPKLSISEYYNFTTGQNELKELNAKLYEALQHNPPIFSSQNSNEDNEVIYVIPYRLTQNNWSLLSFGTSYEKTITRSTEYMRIVHLFDIISNTFDRIALLNEVGHLNKRHQELKERHEVYSRLSEDILFELDFNKKRVWINRKLKFQAKDSPLLGLEQFVHQEDIPLLRKHFYEHYRDNKPFYTELRINDGGDMYYLANVSAESTRDHTGNIHKLIGTVRDISKSSLKHAAGESMHGVVNRRRFYEAIKSVIQAGSNEFALCVLDIDNFKLINDLFGHHVGDDIIEQLSEVLIRSIKEQDHVSRFGGDEFVILFHYERVEEVDQFASQLAESITQHLNHVNHDINLSVSIGISLYPSDGHDYDELLKKADLALYQVKHNGKNNFLKFEPHMVNFQQNKRKMEKILREALVNEQFVLLYQPQVYAGTKRFYGVEVLLRLRTESGVMLTPDKFIPVAESVGLIVPIGAWVIRAACEQGMEWIRRGYDPIKISINISGLQLKSIQFLSSVKNILEETGMNPANLTFEITESTIIDQSYTVLHVIEEIRKLGISVAIDDFGISYSSLSVLKNFPIEILKIDKSFVREMVTDEKGYKIVNAIINIAKSLDLRIVAEGVEDSTQLELLDELGCQFIQGYYISKPINEHEVSKFLPHRVALNHSHYIDSIQEKEGSG
ncbi:hypothetical protein J40TS1_14280 [Paenibacillus montaniterrae]|uniref:Diguanylate cyclase n=1 Tax=Paenibacillus montaniterrae TaxID=429341 RepID=A0A920CWB9_9BACL|nr:EAL domain-containing protein [Paenibacillus montaniterrae]GIP15786.1 hypothetical protein J40TS1_14280 [Paenibacillus montaniterrae]